MQIKNTIISTVTLLGLISVLPAISSAATDNPPAPPEIITPYTAFDPGFKFLESGGGSITNKGNGSTVISGQSSSTQYVDEIGVRLVLQRWNGSTWNDIVIFGDAINKNDYTVYGAQSINVQTDYYYRVKTVHWVTTNGVKEQGERYSNSVLIN
ncbi:DUF6147 family protein [Paenibacillus sp. WC2504]|uniref:DUF6147 family protein n=1 Tax=Paenibacillus sp. WC2504 TaxID=3461403 RepID=UPI004045D226